MKNKCTVCLALIFSLLMLADSYGQRGGRFRGGNASPEGQTESGVPSAAAGRGGRQGDMEQSRFGGGIGQAKTLFSVLDADQDGVISVAEMENAIQAFAVLDENQDGKLTRQEAGNAAGGSGHGHGGGQGAGGGMTGQRGGAASGGGGRGRMAQQGSDASPQASGAGQGGRGGRGRMQQGAGGDQAGSESSESSGAGRGGRGGRGGRAGGAGGAAMENDKSGTPTPSPSDGSSKQPKSNERTEDLWGGKK